MRTPIGRVNKLSLLLIAVLVGAVVAGLVVPGSTGYWIEAGSWIAVIFVVLIEVGFRTTPKYGNYYGDERNPRGSAALERAPTNPKEGEAQGDGPPAPEDTSDRWIEFPKGPT